MAWVPTRLGDHSLTVRATDESGRVQQDLESTDAGLDGFDGFHRVLVAVVD